MYIRSTTNGVLNGYRYNLQTSFNTLNHALNTMLTCRTFNSFGEDPAAATQAFQLRRAFLRTDSQYTVGSNVVRRYEIAYSTSESVVNRVDNTVGDRSENSFDAILRAANDPTGPGRLALGQELDELAESIVQSMNSAKYGDTFVFAGADGLKVPFEWKFDENGEKAGLLYRGVDVNAAKGSSDEATLKYLSEQEATYVDIGLGIQEDNDGEIISASAFNATLQGINFLGYGMDEEGDPVNVVSQVVEMSKILRRCNQDTGAFASTQDKEDFIRLANKFKDSADILKTERAELTTTASFLKTNQTQLEKTADTLNEQLDSIERVDLADAISSFSWAQYCYNAALKMGNSVLSQSLMDYMS